MTPHEMRYIYTDYARKEKELAGRQALDIAGERGKMKDDPGESRKLCPDLAPSHWEMDMAADGNHSR